MIPDEEVVNDCPLRATTNYDPRQLLLLTTTTTENEAEQVLKTNTL
mgnify:CR=1 FL=1